MKTEAPTSGLGEPAVVPVGNESYPKLASARLLPAISESTRLESSRIAFLLGTFPVISETFIVRQIAGLLERGHDIHIFADCRGSVAGPLQPEVTNYKLLERTRFMDMPAASAPYELPVRPLLDVTWTPGEAQSVRNIFRIARAAPAFLRAYFRQPRLAVHALSPAEHKYQANSLSALYRLSRLLRENRGCEILHAHFGPNGNSFRFARELWHAPLVVSFHGYDFSVVPVKQGSDVYQRLFEMADLITVNSEYTRLQVAGLGCPASRIRKLPVGLDLDEFAFKERRLKEGEPIRLLTIGRLVEIKGHEYVIRALPVLRNLGHPVQYHIVGEGPLQSKLRQLVRALGLEEDVLFHGPLAGEPLKEILDAAHIFVLASVTVDGAQEGQGLGLQEAQAVGLPVIATNHGALPEGMVPGRSGFLVPERHVPALAEKLRFLIEHDEIWPFLGRSGRAFVAERYDIRKLTRQLEDLYLAAKENFRQTAGAKAA